MRLRNTFQWGKINNYFKGLYTYRLYAIACCSPFATSSNGKWRFEKTWSKTRRLPRFSVICTLTTEDIQHLTTQPIKSTDHAARDQHQLRPWRFWVGVGVDPTVPSGLITPNWIQKIGVIICISRAEIMHEKRETDFKSVYLSISTLYSLFIS